MLYTYVAFTDRMIKSYEGGYGWDKADPGGPTKYGITCYDLAEHMGQKMDSMTRWAPVVRAMTLETAEAIYKTKYAAKVRYDDLPAGVDTSTYDYGVNSGYARPIRVLRSILKTPGGVIMDDGLINAIRAHDPAEVIKAINAERLQFMHAIRGGSAWAQFGGGWGARVADLKAYSLHLAAEAKAGVQNPAGVPKAPDLSNVATPKVVHGSTTSTSTTVKTTVPSAGAAAGAAHEGGFPPWAVGAVFAGVAVIGIGAIFYQRQKALALNAAVSPPIVLGPAPVALAA